MMDVNKVQILVQEGEGLTVEFKDHFTPRIDEDIVAFANTKGGVILLGVRDDRTVSGEKLTNDMKARINSAVMFLKKHLNCRSEIKGVSRKDIYEIPFEALREAVANAIIHRDYSMRGTSLMVEVYDDRVEIVDPGVFPGAKKKDFGKISVRRNEHIADLFFRMDKVERAGTGIRRMKEAMAAAGLSAPHIRQTDFYTITFKRPIEPNGEKGGGKIIGRAEKRLVDGLADPQAKPMHGTRFKTCGMKLHNLYNEHYEVTSEAINRMRIAHGHETKKLATAHSATSKSQLG